MIKLKALELQGFRRFKNHTRIDFPDSGMLLLDGYSEAGKSSILQAIAYALGVSHYPSTTLKSWSGEPLQVVLFLQKEDTEIKISRGTKSYFQYGGQDPKTGAKALDEELHKLFKLDPDILAALTYRPQDRLGLFLSLSDGEKKEFLGKVLGLDAIEKALAECEKARKDLEIQIGVEKQLLIEREAVLAKAQQEEISPDPVDVGYEARVNNCQFVVDKLKIQLDEAKAELNATLSVFEKECEIQKMALGTKLQQAKDYLKQFKEINQQARAKFDEEFRTTKDKVYAIDTQLQALARDKTVLAGLRAEVETLQANTCYTCHQPYVAEDKIQTKLEKIKQIEENLQQEPVFLGSRTEALNRMAALKYVPDEREGKFANVVGQIESEIKLLGKTITDTRVITAQDRVQALSQTVYKASSDLSDARWELTSYQKAVGAKTTTRAKLEAAVKEASEAVETKRSKLAELEFALNAELDFNRAIGKEGFLGVIFEEILKDISVKANDILAKIPSTSTITVTFKTENAKGKKTIVPVFWVDGNEANRHSGLSGGAGACADLAVDLGVISVLEQRIGVSPGWLALDETFNGMPRAMKEAILEVLQTFSQDKLVLVIDHGTEFKEMFTKVLQVRQENGISVVS